MRKVLASLSILGALAAGQAHANCVGTGAMRSCYDSRTGNNYQIQQFGNTTQMQGYNPNTGSNWNQTSQTYGNTTHHSGTASNGNTWNSTTQRIGNQTFTHGIDSQGNSFSKTCNQYGCF